MTPANGRAQASAVVWGLLRPVPAHSLTFD